MTTKEPSRKQVIISISNNNKAKFMEFSSLYITNLNRNLKNIKSDILTGFVYINQADITIVTNKVALSLDLQTIEKYIKNANYIDSNKVNILCLPQSKSYLKIIGIYYLLENTNTIISLDIVKEIIKSNHIFNNIVVASKPCIIKVSPKLDMAIIQLDIWNVQSSSKTKELINRCFNIGNHIIIISDTNINSRISQCKNCWKVTFSCRVQGSKCIKCNGPHKMEHHCQFAQCCKANFKTNPPRLKTKQSELCSYSFKCLNCKGKYQADLNTCPFQKYCFNREQYFKKYQELQNIRAEIN